MIERPDWGSGGREMVSAGAMAAAGDPLGAVALQREMENWTPAADVPAGASLQTQDAPIEAEALVPDIGLTPSYIQRLQRSPDGFEASYGWLLNCAADFIEAQPDPAGFVRAFDALNPSLQMKAYEVVRHNPGASWDVLHRKLRGAATLAEAHELDKLARWMNRAKQ